MIIKNKSIKVKLLFNEDTYLKKRVKKYKKPLMEAIRNSSVLIEPDKPKSISLLKLDIDWKRKKTIIITIVEKISSDLYLSNDTKMYNRLEKHLIHAFCDIVSYINESGHDKAEITITEIP